MAVELSIVVPFTDHRLVQSAVQSIQKQRAVFLKNKVEIILVYNGEASESEFKPPSDLSLMCVVEVLTSPVKKNVSVARNLGAERARGKFLLFLDSEIEIDENLLSVGLEMMREGGDLLQFPIVPVPLRKNGFNLAYLDYFATRHSGSDGSFCILNRPYAKPVIDSAVFFVTRDFFERTGGFRADLLRAEDRAFSLKVKAEGAIAKFSMRSRAFKKIHESPWRYFLKEVYDSYQSARLYRRTTRPTLKENNAQILALHKIICENLNHGRSFGLLTYLSALHWAKFFVFYFFCKTGQANPPPQKQSVFLGDEFSYLVFENNVKKIPITNAPGSFEHFLAARN